jgi:alpha-tubulin suppressor-like RCC1 family protein
MFQLGIPDISDTETPRPVKNMNGVHLLGLTAGGGSNAAIIQTAEGKRQLWTWGCNDSGALGRLTTSDEDQILPAPVDDFTGKDLVQVSCGDSRILGRTDI